MVKQSLISRLQARRNAGSKYGIERMQWLTRHLGDPQEAYPVIHVAGTNGKGSTCAMLRTCLQRGGYRVGLFTSPHLVRVNERIEIDGAPIADNTLLPYLDELLKIETPDGLPSFFELITAAAFLAFRDAAVDVAVLETGLGGRLDATNVVRPLSTAITSIALDHTLILGNTLAAIATEKAGILKPGVPAILGQLPPEAEEAIRSVANRIGAPVTTIREAYKNDPSTYPETNLIGSFQRRNAAVATLVLQSVQPQLPLAAEVIASGLGNVRWPARWQRVDSPAGPRILDATHNAEGAAELAANLRDLVRETSHRIPIAFGTIDPARGREIVAATLPFAASYILLAPDQPRAVPTSWLRTTIPATFEGTVEEPGVPEFARRPDPRLILITGSLYLIGEIMAHWEMPPEDSLRLQDLR